ncbi:MAG: hypothetical protein JJE45_00140 [Prolixibacteraceae bacterium]|nr:hypothetical protein [Prolixibacteraceae bacterium]
MEEQILKIIKESWNNYYDEGDTQYTVPEIVVYVMEFIEWIIKKRIMIDWEKEGQYLLVDLPKNIIFKSSEELYDYWFVNIKNK